MTFFNSTKLAALATGASALAIATPAMAQDSETEESAGNTNSNVIIVTAQKRAQDLQDVPISISAFDEGALETARIDGVDDLGVLTPGLYVTPNPADNNGVRLNIRGIGTFDPQVGQDSRVAVYVDGVYSGKSQGLAFDSPDLERVEIVKGPQGTLYGRNAVAGAINLISKRPNGDGFSGEISGGYGRFNAVDFNAAINIPISDTGGIRISGSYKDEDGWVENTGLGADFGGGERLSFRVAFGADLTPDLRFDMAYDRNESKAEPLFYQGVPGFTNAAGPPTFFGAAVPTRTGRQNTTATSFENERGDLATQGITTSLEWDYADNHSLKLIGSYRDARAAAFVTLIPEANPFILNGIINADLVPQVPGVQSVNTSFRNAALNLAGAGLPIRAGFADLFIPSATPGPQAGLFLSPPGAANQLHDHEQYSFEATFTGELADGQLLYTSGFYYFNEKTGNDPNQPRNPNDFSSLLLTLGALNPAIGVALTPPQFVSPQVPAVQGLLLALGQARSSTAGALRIQTEAFAFYSELTWNITDQLSLTGGLRYSNESKDGQGQPISPFFFDPIDLLGAPIAGNSASIDFDRIDPAFILQYEPNDDFLIYASYKQSFRSGGFNQSAVAPRIAGETFGPDFIFGEEEITAYEVGFKTSLADGRIRFNAAGFYYDLNDLQTTAQTNALLATERVVVNTDEEIWGIEFDALFAVTDTISLNATYSWIDGDAGDVPDFINGGIQVRDELQGTPEHSFVVGASLDQPLSDSLDLFANVNYSYKDDVLSIPADGVRLTNQNLVNGSIGVDWTTSSGNVFTLSVWGQNIFDDEYTIDALPFETFAERVVVFGQPATYGVSFGVEF